MNKYKIKLNGKELGPLTSDDVRFYLAKGKVSTETLVQLLPNGNWQALGEIQELTTQSLDEDATFIRKLDKVSKKVDIPKEFPKEFQFEAKEQPFTPVTDQTKIIKQADIQDKTVINQSMIDYLKADNIQATETKVEEEDKSRPKVTDNQPDLQSDKTQAMDINALKKELDSEARESELEIAQQTIDKPAQKVEIESKKSKKVLYLVILLIFAFLIFDDGEQVEAKRVFKILNPVITYPTQFEVIDQQKAQKLFEEAEEELKENTYPSLIKASEKLRLSVEYKFQDNIAMGELIEAYARLLPFSPDKMESAAKIYKLVQISKAKALISPLYAKGIALFYLNAQKYSAAKEVVEKFLSVRKNNPSKELMSVYLSALSQLGELEKANKVMAKLELAPKKSLEVRIALIDYYYLIGDSKKKEQMIKESLSIYSESTPLLLSLAQASYQAANYDQLEATLDEIEKLGAESNRVYYSQYLEYLGILRISQKKGNEAKRAFQKALSLNESSSLRSKLASLGDVDTTDRLIKESKALELIRLSQQMQTQGNTRIAFKHGLDATQLVPEFVPAKLNLAELQIENGLFNEAINSLESLQRKNISDPGITFTLIEAYLEAYKFADVRRILSTISNSGLVDDYRYYRVTSKYYLYKKDFYNSINWLQLALKKNPLDEQIQYYLAEILIQYRKYEKAKVILRRLIDLDPDNLKYRVAYSNILYEVDGITSAVGYLYTVLKDYPDDPKLLSSIGILYYKTGQQKKYQQIKKQLEKLPKKDASLYAFLINAAKLDYDNKRIIKNAILYLNLRPQDLEMRILLGEKYLEEEQYEKSLEQFRKVEKRLESYPRLQYFMSKLYLLTGDIEKAIELAKKETTQNPLNIEGYVLLGDIYKQEKEFTKAEKMYKKAQKIDDRDVDTLVGLSSISLKRSHSEIAIDLLKRARGIDPNNANTHKLLGDAYRKIGQSALAIESYNIFLELSPNSRYKNQIQSYMKLMQ